MLQTMRDNAQGMIAKIIVGFIIIVFALFGVESIVSMGGGDKPVAVVGDMEISELDVQRTVNVQKQELRRQFGEQFDENIFNDQFLRNSAIERLVDQRVAISQANELGLHTPMALIDQTILGTPAFQKDGVFDAEQYKFILGRNALTPVAFKQQLAEDLKVTQSQALMILSSINTPYDVQLTEALGLESRVFLYKEFKTADIINDIVITEEELQQEYDTTKNTLLSPEKVSLQYLELVKKSYEELVSLEDQDIEEAYAQYVTEAEQKEQRQARHIMLELGGESDEKTLIDNANDIIVRLSGGESFESLVAERSDDIGTKQNGGNLGFSSKGVLSPALDDAIFMAEEIGLIEQPIVTEFGVHIVELLDIKSAEIKSIDDMRPEITKELSEYQLDTLFAEAQQEFSNVAFSANSIEEVAESFSLEIQDTELFTQNSGSGIASISEVRKIAFEDNIKFDKEISPLVETDEGVIIFTVNEVVEPSIIPFEQVADQIKNRLKREKALDQVNSIATTAAESADYSGWSTIETKFKEVSDVPRAVHQKAFSIAEGETETVGVPGGVAAVFVQSITRADPQDIEVTADTSERIRTQNSRADVLAFEAWGKSTTTIDR